MTREDLMTLKSLTGGGSLTPFEATTIAQREARRINGATTTALVLGGGAILLGAAAWIGSSMFAAAKNKAMSVPSICWLLKRSTNATNVSTRHRALSITSTFKRVLMPVLTLRPTRSHKPKRKSWLTH